MVISELLKLGQPLFLVDVPHVSSRLGNDVAQPMEKVVVALARMLRQEGFTKAVWAGHSFGTGAVACIPLWGCSLRVWRRRQSTARG